MPPTSVTWPMVKICSGPRRAITSPVRVSILPSTMSLARSSSSPCSSAGTLSVEVVEGGQADAAVGQRAQVVVAQGQRAVDCTP